ncbi:MAG: HAMP domain-containing sensor histidine kinase [Elusimicrobiota bacterium]
MGLMEMVLVFSVVLIFLISILIVVFGKNSSQKAMMNLKKNFIELSDSYKQLEDFEQAKSSFVSLIVNEMRSPLTTIKGFAMTLQMKDNQINEVKRKEYLKIIDLETGRLLRIMEKLINTSQVESEKIPASWKSINLHDVIKRVLAKLEIKARKIQFNLDFSLNFPAVFGDEDKLEEAITTLIELCLEVINLYGVVAIVGAEEEGEVKITITLAGENLNTEQINLVISNLTNLAMLEKKSFLPDPKLALAKAIIEIHRGKIAAENLSNRSFQISFSLPKNK